MGKATIILKSRSVLELNEDLEKAVRDTVRGMGLDGCLNMLANDFKAALHELLEHAGWVTETEAGLLDPSSDITKSKGLSLDIKDKEEMKKMAEFTSLKEIVEQLKHCGYECEAGPLVNNVAFQKLAEMAEVDIESGDETYYVDQIIYKDRAKDQ
ncbi:hypothetical protein 015DV002_241 [Bacillus phage 015DV002]|nr:hypothetical protein 015DV002_241 [Bacillus phage 015DV002]